MTSPRRAPGYVPNASIHFTVPDDTTRRLELAQAFRMLADMVERSKF